MTVANSITAVDRLSSSLTSFSANGGVYFAHRGCYNSNSHSTKCFWKEKINLEQEASSLGEWLQAKRDQEGLSLRQMATKVGVSHQTIVDLMDGGKALPTTLKKLIIAFGGNHHQKVALEDKLLFLAGYRTEPREGALSESLARLLDKLNELDVDELGIVEQFTDFVRRTEKPEARE